MYCIRVFVILWVFLGILGSKMPDEVTASTAPVGMSQTSTPTQATSAMASSIVRALPQNEFTKLKRELQTSKMILTKSINRFRNLDLIDASSPYIEGLLNEISSLFTKIKDKQTQYVELNLDRGIPEQQINSLIDQHLEFQFDTQKLISDLRENALPSQLSTSINSPSFNQTSPPGPSQFQPMTLKLPELKINTFSDNDSNCFAFHQFKASFLNALNAFPTLTESSK